MVDIDFFYILIPPSIDQEVWIAFYSGFASYFLGVGQPPKTPPLPGVKNPIAKLPPPTRRERRNSGKAQTNGTIPSNNPSENVLQIDDYPAFFQQVGAKLADQSFQNILIQQFRQEIKTLEGSEFERLKQMVNEVEVMQADSSKNNAPVMKA
ncbi:hypothetical protein BKA69DRAFT_1122545 [Paraphysoderma sedebokerense]|nr:hypothetical protein BKA69DRAFT_1122545 [Paraphysoderma sedebokerense]